MTDRTWSLFYIARNGDTRGRGKNREIYYRGEWISRKAHETSVKGDRVTDRIVTNPDFAKAMRAVKRRPRKQQ